MSGLFITGTDTGVGKTVVAAGLARLLSDRGTSVGALKPVETGWEGSGTEWPPDGRLLADAARMQDTRSDVVPHLFAEPLAPLVAARRCGQPIEIAVIERAFEQLHRRYDCVLVEGAGGLSVPITESVWMADLAKRLRLPVLVVARPTLGTLNHTFLTVHYARTHELNVLGVVINGSRVGTTDVAEQTNPAMIEEMCRVPVLGMVPRRPSITTPEEAAEALAAGLDLDRLRRRYHALTGTDLC
ncbi:MAG: dethiobiotin synthase [Rhodothermales bacterium]